MTSAHLPKESPFIWTAFFLFFIAQSPVSLSVREMMPGFPSKAQCHRAVPRMSWLVASPALVSVARAQPSHWLPLLRGMETSRNMSWLQSEWWSKQHWLSQRLEIFNTVGPVYAKQVLSLQAAPLATPCFQQCVNIWSQHGPSSLINAGSPESLAICNL